MVQVSTVARILLRIALGYGAACVTTAFLMFLLSALMGVGQPMADGQSAFDDFTNQAGWLPFYVFTAGLFAAPVAGLGIITSEVAKIDRLWFFLLIGALGSVPVLFMGPDRSVSETLEGFVMFGPIGAASGAVYWLVRFRAWPIESA